MLRALLGLIGSSLFTASEAWINLLASDAMRGRILGMYAAALSAGFGLGPLLLAWTGIAGWAPFIANAAITAAAALPLLAARGAAGLERRAGASPLAMFIRAPAILLMVALFGFYETAMMALLPVWGVRVGLGERAAAATLAAVYIGAIVLQVPFGWLSDRAGRRAALCLCGAVGFAGAALLPMAAPLHPALFALLFIWGGLAGGVYAVALGMAGDRFRNGELIAINAAIVMAYGMGALAGPVLGGAAMDAYGPLGLAGYFAAVFAALSVFALFGGRPRVGR